MFELQSTNKGGAMLKKLSLLFGAIFILVGILGFVPGITDNQDMLFGVFKVGAVYNLAHLLSGVIAFLVAKSEDRAQLYFRTLGGMYVLIALVGWAQGDTVFGLIAVNVADNLLHTVLGAAILGIGFGVPKSK